MNNTEALFHSQALSVKRKGLKPSRNGEKCLAIIDVEANDANINVLKLSHPSIPKDRILEMPISQITDVSYSKEFDTLILSGFSYFVTPNDEIIGGKELVNEIPMSLGMAVNIVEILKTYDLLLSADMEELIFQYRKQIKNTRVNPVGIEHIHKAMEYYPPCLKEISYQPSRFTYRKPF